MSRRYEYVDYSNLNKKMKDRREEQRAELERYDDLDSVPRTVLPSSNFGKASARAHKEGRLHCRISQAHLKGGLIDPSEQNNGATQKPLQKLVIKRKKK